MSTTEMNIILIDDDEDDFVHIREVLADIKGGKFKLTWLPSFKEGIEALKKGTFDACLLDYRLGEKDGIDFLRESQKLGINCPIIFLTGHGDFDLDIQAMQVGAADYLVKSQLSPNILESSLRYGMKHALDLKELRDKEENFRTLFNSTFEGIIVQRAGIVVDVNASAAEIFGYDQSEMVGTPLADYISSGSSGASPYGEDIYGKKKDGNKVFIEVAYRTIYLKGLAVFLVAVRDLTQRRQMEAQILQQDRLASLGLLASSLAHEIGTPLGIIRGRAELVSKHALENEKITQDMNLITTQIDRIAKLVNSLLHLARDRRSTTASTVKLSDAIQDVTTLLKYELDRNGIDLEVDLNGEHFVKAETGPLGQVLLNFFVNSVHAIQEAQRSGRKNNHKIRIEAHDGGDNLMLSVADTGCGIPEENLSQLFKPFFTTKDVGVGTGLGLATSYNSIRSWGGSVRVESKVDQGAKFIIQLKKAQS